jgi:hypothetical protein
VSGSETPTGSASLVLALAVVFASFIPLWPLVLWMAKSSVPWRWVTEGRWVKWLAWLVYALIAIVLANAGAIWVHHDLLGPSRPAEQRIVYGVWVAQAVLWILALAWAKGRRGGPSVPPSPTVVAPPKLRRKIIVIVLLAWVALAGAFAAWRFGPLGAEPPSAHDRSALALACVVIATLIVLLVKVSREARRTATRNGGDFDREQCTRGE